MLIDTEATTMSANIVIDAELAALLTPHTPEELAVLARSLQEEGCRDALAVWQGTGVLLDGHARHRLCTEHGVPFEVVEIDLADHEAAVRWVLELQLGRRNLRPIAASYFRGHLYLSLRKKVGRPSVNQKSGRDVPISTDEQVAARYAVDPRTIRRDASFAKNLDQLAGDMGEAFRSSVLSGEARLTRKDINALARMGRRERERFIRDRNLAKYPPPPTALPAPGNVVLRRLADLWRLADEETRRTFLAMPEAAAALEEAACR
jgi:hypothetical protein